jgi:cystathionine beta-lyase/cystathionine gamma-synthase
VAFRTAALVFASSGCLWHRNDSVTRSKRCVYPEGLYMTSEAPAQERATVCARAAAPAQSSSHPLVAPIELSVVYCPDDLDHVDALSEGGSKGFIYARDGHPNAAQLAAKIARLEGAQVGLVCSSGMGAIASVFLTLLSQSDHALVSDGVYGKTSTLVKAHLSRWGITHATFDPADAGSLPSLLNSKTRLIFVETMSNPLLRVADLGTLGAIAQKSGVPLVVDNTFAPLICQPIEHGASLVVHSATKTIGGHSDLTLGVVVGARTLIESIRPVASTLGQTGNPFESWLASRGLATLHVRLERACSSALELARRLEAHPSVDRVYYPGLESHRDFTVALRLLNGGFGTIITIDLTTRARADSLIRELRAIPFAPSLGDIQTTLSHPGTTSHRGLDDAERGRQGITPGMIRLSVGLEDVDDLWADLDQALPEQS